MTWNKVKKEKSLTEIMLKDIWVILPTKYREVRIKILLLLILFFSAIDRFRDTDPNPTSKFNKIL